ncbi:MAG: hypothetical protein AVDCRST_MAG69-550, partial [uncultured Solirubrobacteraceae bacterium]
APARAPGCAQRRRREQLIRGHRRRLHRLPGTPGSGV